MGETSMSVYDVLVFVHIFSAIVGMGLGFFMVLPVKRAQTMTELRYGYVIRNRLHWVVMMGGTLLLLTGLLMGFLIKRNSLADTVPSYFVVISIINCIICYPLFYTNFFFNTPARSAVTIAPTIIDVK